MSQWRFHWIEKTQVQLASALGIVACYLLLWPMVRPADPLGPLAMLAHGRVGAVALVLAASAVLAGTGGLITTHSRPVGAVVTALLGIGGLSLRSPWIRPLLWSHEGSFPGLYAVLAVETLLLSLAWPISAIVAAFVRSAIAGARPEWTWRDPLEPASTDEDDPAVRWYQDYRAMLARLIAPVPVGAPSASRHPRQGRPNEWINAPLCMVMCGAVSSILLLLLLQSPLRGQVLFALLASCTLGMLLAHQVYPTRHSGVAWATPVVLAMAFYTLSAIHAGGLHGSDPEAWRQVGPWAQILPIDWLTAGCGGAGLGVWISSRVHELRHIESQQKKTV
jgi:hypothetical protein